MPSLGSHVARAALRTWMKPQLARRALTLSEVRRTRARIARHYRRRALNADMTTQALRVGGIETELTRPIGVHTHGHVILYLHGGGFLVGSPTMYRKIAVRLAREALTDVVVPDYRLAPEHPWPAAPRDVLATYRGLLDAGHRPERIAVVGDSAGGNLVLALLQQIRAAGLPMPASATCLSPWADLTGSGATMESHRDIDPMLPAQRLHCAARAYAPDRNLADPRISPVFADYAGFPPLLVQVGSEEVLLDDARRVVAAARRDGVAAQLCVWNGQPHVFQMLAHIIPEGRAAIADVATFVREHWVDHARSVRTEMTAEPEAAILATA